MVLTIFIDVPLSVCEREKKNELKKKNEILQLEIQEMLISSVLFKNGETNIFQMH